MSIPGDMTIIFKSGIENSLQVTVEVLDSTNVVQLTLIGPTVFGYNNFWIMVVILDPTEK